jgi:Na+:H+ antiporter, NhaA family
MKFKTKLSSALREFISKESSGGLVMLIATCFAIMLANSYFAEQYKNFTYFSLPFGLTIKSFVKDILMVLFFFVVGMELKKEILTGFLSKREQIFLPLIVAIAGMFVPAIIYNFFNSDILATKNGWAIPSATDIAFALCVLTLFGRAIPPSIKIFLLAIAIFDDLGAILIIAFFYSSGVQLSYLFLSAIIAGALYYINKKELTQNTLIYLIGGAVLVILFELAGIHTTVAGVITGFLIPLSLAKTPSVKPLESLMHKINPWVAFLILPVFAFVSAGISFTGVDSSMLFSPVSLGVACGLFFGKQIGILGATYGLVKLKYTSLPEGADWKDIYAVSILAGIGFTMSLFISQLAFTDPVFQEQAKIGILTASLFSAILGAIILRRRK